MVLLDSVHLRDVILLVEDTALNGAYVEEEMRGNYLLPCLEYLSRGRDEEWGDVLNCSSYHLLSFSAADSHPRSSTKLQGPFISYKRLLDALDRLSWSGGAGETHSCGVEGLAAALRVFDKVDAQRRSKSSPSSSSKFLIYLANSPYYDVPVRVKLPLYAGKRMEELLHIIHEREIHLTVLSPRKLPTLVRMFKGGGGDLHHYKEKNYAKDQRHLVLLSGIQLQETPLVVINPSQTQQQQQQPMQQQQTQQVPSQASMMTTPNAQNFQGQQAVQQPQQVMQRAPLRPPQMHLPQQQQQQICLQQQNQRMQQQRLLSSGGTVVAPSSQSPQVQPNTRPSNAWQQQQLQQQQGGSSNILRDRLKPQPLVQQQQTDNPTLKTLLNHPPQPVGNQTPSSGPSIIMNPQQQINNPRMPGNLSTLQQQLSRPPNVSIAGSMSQINAPQAQQQQQTQQATPVGQNRPREKIWEGELTWRDSIKVDMGGQDYKAHSVVCSVTTAVNEKGDPDVNSNSWPKKLIMQVIPKALVQNIGGNYFRNARSVFFHPEPCESLTALTRSLGSGYAGCVHFTGSPNCEIKVLILLYSSEKGAYLGFIPNEQYKFVERVRQIIQQERTEQQIMANRHGGAAGGPGPSSVPVSMAQVRPGVPVSQNQQQVQVSQGISIQNPQQPTIMQMATTTMSVSGSNMNIQSGGTGVMAGGHMGQVLPQQSGAMGSVEIIQSLEQELQRQKNFYRQQQQQQQQQQIQRVRPDGSQLMQQQQRMPGQNNIRQIIAQPHFQQRPQQPMGQQHLFMQPVMGGAQGNSQQQQQQQQQSQQQNQQQQNDAMLRELLA